MPAERTIMRQVREVRRRVTTATVFGLHEQIVTNPTYPMNYAKLSKACSCYPPWGDGCFAACDLSAITSLRLERHSRL
jgi:hypothetical protein